MKKSMISRWKCLGLFKKIWLAIIAVLLGLSLNPKASVRATVFFSGHARLAISCTPSLEDEEDGGTTKNWFEKTLLPVYQIYPEHYPSLDGSYQMGDFQMYGIGLFYVAFPMIPRA